VQEGRFRQDLYYRLAVVAIELPPLHERLEDIPLLSDAFRRDFAEKHGKQVDGIQDDVMERFRKHRWPGNVRELRNAIETMVVLDRDGELGLDDLPAGLRHAERRKEVSQAPGGARLLAPSAEVPPSPHQPSAEPPSSPAAAEPRQTEADRASPQLAGRTLRAVEAELIRQTLDACRGNRQKAAEQLGMGERTLYRKIKEYDLQ
jgi:two-component system response regulator HydG